ncbi:MAG TPA: sigma factor-like helix-turn-helix DNA-binding protein [Polyangia bacterium]|nr:sigma factor-like helix-turn-helix DNA-binding protein [Polyangia bacterium]
MRRYEHTHVEPVAAPPEPLPAGEAVDPYAVRSALLSFLALPVLQRSAVILKDVLGHSLGEIASTIGTTVPAVKAALARGRSKLRQMGAQGPETREGAMAADELEDLRRYARLFNATRLGRCPRAAGRRVPA